MTFKLYLWCLGIGVAFSLLNGCSHPSPKSEPPSKTENRTPLPRAQRKYKIAGVGFQDDQFFKLIEFGMKAAAEKNGVELSLGTSAGSLDKEIALVDAYIAQKVDALAIAPISQKGSIAALKRAHDSGIKVVTFDSHIEADFPVSNIKSDQVSLGKLTGEEAVRYIQERMGGKAKVAIITYMSLFPEAASQRTQGFEEEVKKLPGVEIVAKQDAWIASAAVDVVEQVLAAHPEVNLIWAANEGGTVGAVTAVKNSGKAGKIVVFGTDISEQMADFLLSDDDILQAVTGQKPFDIGVRAIETALNALEGERVEKKVRLPGVLFTRREKDKVKQYKDYLHDLTR
ncbi:MAG: substrate-binding domain-containing protein [Abditibacteriales bacterium]|nr:substrate-binding domain-containing protein [Abditibacteriales bacterium]MDW8367927.1 substrate-binding domain-containing protein [Abditibacteriales bacterium]